MSSFGIGRSASESSSARTVLKGAHGAILFRHPVFAQNFCSIQVDVIYQESQTGERQVYESVYSLVILSSTGSMGRHSSEPALLGGVEKKKNEKARKSRMLVQDRVAKAGLQV
jgi:hypothetical protein